MTSPMPPNPDDSGRIPKPVVKRMWRPYPLIWLVPLVAAAVPGWFLYQHYHERGPEIILRFDEASGLKAGETHVTHRGVEIGTVSAVTLSDDKVHVLVKVRLQRSEDRFAQEGARFWIVRPEISVGNVSGLNTIMSGPYIDAAPGSGKTVDQFIGLEKPPVTTDRGLRIVLHVLNLLHLQADSPVYYRGVQVGVVQDTRLSSDGAMVDIPVLIQPRYAPLVRTNSQFWALTGADVEGGLFSGVQVKLESLRALISGGIAFASPDRGMGNPAQDGANFPLNAEPKKEWLAWSPRIPLPDDQPDGEPNAVTLPQTPNVIRSAVK